MLWSWILAICAILIMPCLLWQIERSKPLTILAGKTVLLTGGAGGLGKALATEFSKRGCKVISCDLLNQEQVSGIIYLTCDVSNHDQIRNMVSQISKEHGPIDVLINNAGIVNGGSILDLSPEQIQKSFEVNILSHFWLIKFCQVWLLETVATLLQLAQF